MQVGVVLKLAAELYQAVTTLQLAHAYQVLSDQGLSVPVSFVKQDTLSNTTRVVPKKVANTVIKMLETVVEKGGTGWRARVPALVPEQVGP